MQVPFPVWLPCHGLGPKTQRQGRDSNPQFACETFRGDALAGRRGVEPRSLVRATGSPGEPGREAALVRALYAPP